MAGVGRIWTRTRQPQQFLSVSPTVPAGLVTANTFAGIDRQIVGSQVFARAGSGHLFTPATSKGLASGIGLSNGGSGYFTSSAPNRTLVGLTAGGAFSFFFTLKLNSTSQTNRYIAQEYNSSGGGQSAFIYGYVANTFELYTNNMTGTDPRASSAIAAPNDTLVHTVGYTYDGATFRGYLDGAEMFATAITFTLPSYNSGHLLSANGGAAVVDAVLLQHVVFDRGVSPGWARSYTANPAILFRQSRKVSRAFTVSAGGTTVAVPAGALTLTGYAPTVSFTAHQTIAVPAGALTLTGFAPTVSTSASQTIAVPAASLTLTGFAPTVAATANQSISVPAGSLTLTGYAPTVYTTAVTTIAVPAGTLTLTGYAPTVSYTTHAYIGVPAGALTLTGYAPTVTGGTSSIWTPASASSGTWTPASASGGTWTPQ